MKKILAALLIFEICFLGAAQPLSDRGDQLSDAHLMALLDLSPLATSNPFEDDGKSFIDCSVFVLDGQETEEEVAALRLLWSGAPDALRAFPADEEDQIRKQTQSASSSGDSIAKAVKGRRRISRTQAKERAPAPDSTDDVALRKCLELWNDNHITRKDTERIETIKFSQTPVVSIIVDETQKEVSRQLRLLSKRSCFRACPLCLHVQFDHSKFVMHLLKIHSFTTFFCPAVEGCPFTTHYRNSLVSHLQAMHAYGRSTD